MLALGIWSFPDTCVPAVALAKAGHLAPDTSCARIDFQITTLEGEGRIMNATPGSTKGTRDFAQVVTWSAALSMALSAAILASVRQVNPTVEFRFSVMTVIAFLVAGPLTAAVFRKIFNATSTGTASLKRWPLVLFFAVVLATLVVSIVFALRGVSGQKRMEIAVGTGTALLAVTFGGYLGWRAIRFLEADDKRNRVEDRSS